MVFPPAEESISKHRELMVFLCSLAQKARELFYAKSVLYGGEHMASAKILEQKQAIVQSLADQMKNAAGGVLVNCQGITVEADTKLRAELRNAGVEYSVVKNTLTSRACDIVGFENLKDVLSGMTAMATSESDPIAPAKILCTFAEKNPNFVIKAGFVEGNLLDEKGVQDLAKTPSKEVLIGKMLGSLQSSLYSFAYVLQAIIDKSGEAPVAEEATEAAAE